jgi:hypothetical protein
MPPPNTPHLLPPQSKLHARALPHASEGCTAAERGEKGWAKRGEALVPGLMLATAYACGLLSPADTAFLAWHEREANGHHFRRLSKPSTTTRPPTPTPTRATSVSHKAISCTSSVAKTTQTGTRRAIRCTAPVAWYLSHTLRAWARQCATAAAQLRAQQHRSRHRNSNLSSHLSNPTTRVTKSA